LLRLLIFYNRLAIGQKDRSTVTYLRSAALRRRRRQTKLLDASRGAARHMTSVRGDGNLRYRFVLIITRRYVKDLRDSRLEKISGYTRIVFLAHGLRTSRSMHSEATCWRSACSANEWCWVSWL